MIRMTVYGRVAGVSESGAHAWKGIPFARPPVGPLRWKAPREPEAWTGIRDAGNFGPGSAQFGTPYGPGANNRYDASIAATLGQAVGSEDSLTLNIWRPATDEVGLPVIFFIHGGANVSGYSADPMYDGAALAREANAVVVTANYRLGLLGWLDLEALRDGEDPLDDSGNFGTLDQIQALKFTHRNIASFGGNPGNVTLMGESAGAVAVYSLLTSPLLLAADPPLFHRAVPLSGGMATPDELPPGSLPTIAPESYRRAQSARLLESLLIADGKADDAASAADFARTLGKPGIAGYLRSKSPAQLFEKHLLVLRPLGLDACSPIPDGLVIADTPLSAIRSGRYLKVPILAGSTKDEGRLFFHYLARMPELGGKDALIMSDARRFETMRLFDPDGPATVRLEDLIDPSYLPVDAPVTGYQARLDRYAEMLLGINGALMLRTLARQQRNIWFYRFDWDKEPPPWNDLYGAAHLFDIPFLFGNFGPSLFSRVMGGKANEAGRLALSAAMMRSLAAFARHGDPNHAGLGVTWPVWPAILHFDATLTDKMISVSTGSTDANGWRGNDEDSLR